MKTKHFFLEGMELDDLSKLLICHSTREVLVVNPYVEQCDLSNTLRDHVNKNVRVVVVTRPPKQDDSQSLERKRKYHEILSKEGVDLVYNENVHAKLIVVDRTVAIVSSMNFYSGSSAGASWEAGLVSTDNSVVDSVTNYILELKEKPESRELESSRER